MKAIDLIDESFEKQRSSLIKKSTAYKVAEKNNIDTDIIEGKKPDENSGEVKFEKMDETESRIFMKDVADFFLKDLPRDTLISIGNGGVNLGHFLNNVAYVLDPNVDEMDQEAYDNLYSKLDEIKKKLGTFEEDSPFISKLVSMLPQSQMYTYPIYKKLNNSGLPKGPSLIISSAMSEALAFDKSETFFTDSRFFRAVKETFNLPADTPYEEVVDKFMQFGEYLFYTGAGEKLLKGILDARKIKAEKAQQGAIAVGAGAAAGAAVSQLETEFPNQSNTEIIDANESEEKKTLNFEDRIKGDQSMIPGTTNEYGNELQAGLVPVFKSILKETVEKKIQKGSGDQILNTLKNTQGIKQQELKWTGLDEFLKDKKSVTKDEIKEYLNLTQLDIAEVKFGGTAKKPNKQLQSLIDDFEATWSRKSIMDDVEGPTSFRTIFRDNQFPQYDTYYTFIGKEVSEDTRGTMDYSTIYSLIGDDVAATSFENVGGMLKYRTKFNSPVDVEGGDYFFINPVELEKYRIERLRRMRNMNTNQAKFEQYTEPGGKDYTELVFKLKQGGMDKGIPTEVSRRTQELNNVTGDEFIPEKISNVPFKSKSHMNVENEIAHVRFKTRQQGNMNILTVEEMQSDFAIAARKGFANNKDARITDFPYKNNWYELVLKRLIRYAADNNLDAVAIPKGIVSARRYGEKIGKSKRIMYSKNDDNIYIAFLNEAGESVEDYVYKNKPTSNVFPSEFGPVGLSLEQLKKDVGEKAYKQITESDVRGNAFFDYEKPIVFGDGKGKAKLYDEAIPSFMKKYGKKWNAKVYDDGFKLPGTREFDDATGAYTGEADMKVTVIVITDDMKKSVQQDSQALFEILGIGTGAAIGSKAVLEDQGNNTISN